MRNRRLDPPDMEHALAALVRRIPRGRTTTCGGLAAALGDPVAARWVGQWLLHHQHDGPQTDCPCHRVVRAGGVLGGYLTTAASDARVPPEKVKIQLLHQEGVAVVDGRVNLAAHGWNPKAGECVAPPLARLREVQVAWAEDFRPARLKRPPELVAGLDVSYVHPGLAVGAYALVEAASGELLWSITLRHEIRFPYISTYLAFRELPLLWDLFDAAQAAGRAADVYLIDGSGILHPRRGGVATSFGVSTDSPIIGVAKKLLCGHLERTELEPGQWTRIHQTGEEAHKTLATTSASSSAPLGAAIRTSARSKKLIYVSPGQAIDLDAAVRVVLGQATGRRLPEPVYQADRLSRKEARKYQSVKSNLPVNSLEH